MASRVYHSHKERVERFVPEGLRERDSYHRQKETEISYNNE